jgi:hypothetical protein
MVRVRPARLIAMGEIRSVKELTASEWSDYWGARQITSAQYQRFIRGRSAEGKRRDIFTNLPGQVCGSGDPENSRTRLEAGPYPQYPGGLYPEHHQAGGGSIFYRRFPKDATDPAMVDDPCVRNYLTFLEKGYPGRCYFRRQHPGLCNGPSAGSGLETGR